jgi:hypothetical protein
MKLTQALKLPTFIQNIIYQLNFKLSKNFKIQTKQRRSKEVSQPTSNYSAHEVYCTHFILVHVSHTFPQITC